MKRTVLDRLQRERAARRPVALLTWLDDGSQALWTPHDGETGLPAGLVVVARSALLSGNSAVVEDGARRVFVHAHCPPPRMLVVGAVHIAQSLASMARLAGFDVIVIDPRRRFASQTRFAGVELDTRWPDEALQALEPDSRSAVVTLSHDAKLDDAALRVALETDAFYVAALGSQRTHAARLVRLRERGVDDEALARIHGPAGLVIGARGSAEIAVAILAQAIAALRGADGV